MSGIANMSPRQVALCEKVIEVMGRMAPELLSLVREAKSPDEKLLMWSFIFAGVYKVAGTDMSPEIARVVMQSVYDTSNETPPVDVFEAWS